MSKVENNKKQKKDTLLKAAFDLFTEQGITKTSISEIVTKAGVAKGTFYLYFKDKYDIKNKLIAHKASLIFKNAMEAMKEVNIETVEDKIIFIADHVIDQLTENRTLLTFISKNLSWGVFKTALTSSAAKTEVDFYEIYTDLLEESPYEFDQPEILLFLIVEFIGAACHDSILYDEPKPIGETKPYILNSVRNIIKSHIKGLKAETTIY